MALQHGVVTRQGAVVAPAGRHPVRTTLGAASAAVGAALLVGACLGLGARPAELLRALAFWALAALPVGSLLTRGIGREAWTLPVERLALAALVGLPMSAALGFLLALMHCDALLPGFFALFALAWTLTLRRGAAAALNWAHPANGLLILLAGLAALVLTRGFIAFIPLQDGSLVYDHSLEQAIHVAFSWELLRGIPPAELPTAAGLRFPHYHVLGYLPLTWAARWAGVGLLTVHHAMVPPLAILLLAGGVHLTIKARAGSYEASLATLLGLFFVVTIAECLFVPYTFGGRVPLEMLVRSISAGSGILLFVTVAALLAALRTAGDERPLLLAAALVGLSYGVKAQMFLMLGGAFVLLLLLLALRGRARHPALALALLLACAAPLALSGRADTRLGQLHFAPGLFARECGFGPLFAGLGPMALWLLGSPLAVWSILRFSPFVPVFTVWCLRRWRASQPVDLFAALGVGVAVVFSLGLASEEIQRGDVSTLVVREALYAVQVMAVGVDLGVLAWLLGRLGWDGSRGALGLLAAAALALLPWTWRASLHKSPPHPTVLSPGEVGALEYLRQRAPLDAVVAHLRGSARPELQALDHGLHPMPLVAALAGRRTVLEYYRPDIDPSVNRLRALRRLFVTPDAAEGETLLERFGVDYVMEYRFQPLRFASPRLSLAYEGDEVRLWQWMRQPPVARPGPRYAPLGLR